MAADIPNVGAVREVSRRSARFASGPGRLGALAIAAGTAWALAFPAIGLLFQFQLYGDGAIFAYMVAAEDAWAFHWHNISGRVFVYLYASVPAEIYAAVTDDLRGGIALYGFMFFVAPLLGLIATFAADRSTGRKLFCFACASTACLAPMVFGFPTEMWVAHALFWPALAACHFAGKGAAGFLLRFAALLALSLTHLGGIIFAAVAAGSLLYRGEKDATISSIAAFVAAVCVQAIVVWALPPDDYFVEVLRRAAAHVFDANILLGSLSRLIGIALAGYGMAVAVLWKFSRARVHIYAAALVAAGLCIFWLWSGGEIHAEGRYYLRTALIVLVPAAGALAVSIAFEPARWLVRLLPFLPRLRALLAGDAAARFAQGLLVLVVLIHAVETARFAVAWTEYRTAVTRLASGTLSDPALGDPRFVSAARIDPRLHPLGWDSTTPFLSVLLAPRFAPSRLVADPRPGYFWLPCATATENFKAERVLPPASRDLIRAYSCLHRR